MTGVQTCALPIFGRGFGVVRMLKNTFTERYAAAEAGAAPKDEREKLFKSSTLKMAAFEGNIDEGKVEVGQGIGLIDDLPPAGELVRRLAADCEAALVRLNGLKG